jgi:VWFA-related protein
VKFRLTVFAVISLSAVLHAQQSQPAPDAASPADNGLLIHAETNLVLVDTVVTDKKGEYVTDLKAKDFRVSEDGKDMPIKSFSYEADPSSGAAGRTHYLVLMFDNSSMNTGDQSIAREAAGKFIDSNSGPNRMMAVVNYGGAMKIDQNFTTDPVRLKTMVSGVQFPSVSSNSSSGKQTVTTDFAARDMLQSLRSVAKSLGSTPGRKILVLFTAGFLLTPEQQTEATATIAECNRNNVAIYPVDVRGLSTAGTAAPRAFLMPALPRPPSIEVQGSGPSGGATYLPVFRDVAFAPAFPFTAPLLFAPQSKGGGASSSSSSSSAAPSRSAAPAPTTSTTAPSSTGNTRGTTNPTNNNNANMNGAGVGGCAGTTRSGSSPGLTNGGTSSGIGSQPGMGQCPNALIPKLPASATTNQQIMFMLASGTGGFVIYNSNDLIGGLEKIGKEQNQYYILGYTPPESNEGSCHVLKVKVDRGGTEVRARTGYCSAKPMDVLSGSPIVKGLEAKIAEPSPGKVTAGMRLPYFYTSPNIARVNLAMEIAPDGLKFEKKKNVFHAEVNFLGIAYTPQGTVAARFSDILKLDFASKEDADEAKSKPLHYENQFDIASGKYTMKVVYSEGGDNFGKQELPLEISPYGSDALAISGLALSKTFHRASELGAVLDVAMLEDKTPLIADGVQIVPTGNPAFGKSDLALFYVELYEPMLVSGSKDPANLGIRMRVLDRKTGEQKSDTGLLALEPAPLAGNQVVHLGGKIPIAGLPPGAYRMELTVADATDKTAQTAADFDLQ